MLVLALGAGVLAAPSADAAPARVWLERTDPLSTDPVQLRVAAVDVDGFATAFSGLVTLSVGKTTSRVVVSSTDGGEQEVSVPTTSLAGGSATAVAVLKVGGKSLTGTVKGIADIPSTVELRGFGCGVVSPKQTRVAWQVVRLNGQPISYPAWVPDGGTFPAYVRTVHPAGITDSLGKPLTTKGSVVIRRGTTKVATVALPSATRRLLFSVAWRGTVKGRFTPGSYTAALTLTDAKGRTATAVQSLTVAKTTAGLCS